MSPEQAAPSSIPEPWLSFLREADGQLEAPIEIHCIGAFALLLLTGSVRPTADVAFIEALPGGAEPLLRLTEEGSDLERRYRLHFHHVTVAEVPCAYENRLLNMTPAGFAKLVIKVLEPLDVALTKVSRGSPKDRGDFRLLSERFRFDPVALRARYEDELRPYVLIEDRTTATLELWIEEFLAAAP
jgi:hypothetical protein